MNMFWNQLKRHVPPLLIDKFCTNQSKLQKLSSHFMHLFLFQGQMKSVNCKMQLTISLHVYMYPHNYM